MKILLLIFSTCFFSTAHAANFSDSSTFYFSQGMVEKNAKRYLTAATNFEKAIGFNKTYTEAYIENGFAYKEMRKTDDAKANFLKAYALQPSNMDVIKELTNLYFDYRQWDKAIEFAGKCAGCDNAERIIGLSNYEKENYVVAEKALLKSCN